MYVQEELLRTPPKALRGLGGEPIESARDLTFESTLSQNVRAIEDYAFPFEELSDIAEMESWRKEINRPIYHLHKWWARRLGSVFRAILIGSLTSDPSRLLELFYAPVRFPEAVVYDPFMGSGTTLGEGLKLGTRTIGRDINPVAYFAVRNALAAHDREYVLGTYKAIERDVASELRSLYQTRLENGTEVDVLYFFWVKIVSCPLCSSAVDLFSSYVFARHAYPKRYPVAQAVCPSCGAIEAIRYDAGETTCSACRARFDVRRGPVQGGDATCSHCHATFPVVDAARRHGSPPSQRLYAKLVLLPDGGKRYLRAEADDQVRYAEAETALREREDPYPIAPIASGHNTDQILNYGYRCWHDLFNGRQLLGLSLLAERIRAIDDRDVRELFACLFSGILEFNNMFASYKGEGTGAVRHMFAHHILKPERTPLEANIWGTSKSSGSFSTLFRSRLLRALDYQRDPFEVRPVRKAGTKVRGLSAPLGHRSADNFAEFEEGDALYLSCGDSSKTDLPSESVDIVVTDPPFFDNVHYSELADFFYVWQRYVLGNDSFRQAESTRSPDEVQSRDVDTFTDRLCGVLAECRRVLRPHGLLVFTYHHSRQEGWHAILEAITGAGFVITAAQPIKSEMSGAAPKSQARHPIDLDVILVCRKCKDVDRTAGPLDNPIRAALGLAREQAARFTARGRALGRNDVRVVVMAQVIAALSRHLSGGKLQEEFVARQEIVEETIDHIYKRQAEILATVRVSTGER